MTESRHGASRITGPDECRQLLLVGELNPYGADPRYALYCEPRRSAGGRLQSQILSIGARTWYLPIWRVNLCTGDWDGRDAIRKAEELLDDTAPWRTIVMLGVKVQKAFGYATSASMPDNYDYRSVQSAVPFMRRPFTLVSLPHPSGRNAVAWTLDNVYKARGVMREVAPVIPWGELG